MDVGFYLWISSDFYYEISSGFIITDDNVGYSLYVHVVLYRSTLATFDTFMLNKLINFEFLISTHSFFFWKFNHFPFQFFSLKKSILNNFNVLIKEYN
jgi:hypothetical protein